MSTSIYARDPITGAYKEIAAIETAANVWGLRVSDPNAAGGGGGNSTGTQTSVASNVASQVILASNSLRKGATVWNNGSNNLYLRLGAGAASIANATVKLVADAYYEVPFDYTGAIAGIWDVATGSARVTEITA